MHVPADVHLFIVSIGNPYFPHQPPPNHAPQYISPPQRNSRALPVVLALPPSHAARAGHGVEKPSSVCVGVCVCVCCAVLCAFAFASASTSPRGVDVRDGGKAIPASRSLFGAGRARQGPRRGTGMLHARHAATRPNRLWKGAVRPTFSLLFFASLFASRFSLLAFALCALRFALCFFVAAGVDGTGWSGVKWTGLDWTGVEWSVFCQCCASAGAGAGAGVGADMHVPGSHCSALQSSIAPGSV